MAQPTSKDVFAGGYWDHAVEIDAVLRAESAVFRTRLPNAVSVWVITRYEEARAAFTDPRLSKDATLLTNIIRSQLAATGQATELSNMFGPHLLFRDDPAHARLRQLVASQFTHRRVTLLRPRIEAITEELLDNLSHDGPVDLIADVAFPLPLTVIGELLGVPAGDAAALREWTTLLMHDREEITVPASREMAAYLTTLIHSKRAAPGDDLLSALVTATINGDQLSQAEVVGTAFLLVVAGHETTTNLIGNAVRWLVDRPQTWRALGTDPRAVPAVVEEVLRWDSPVRTATHRCTTAPIAIGGVRIPAGEIVLISLASANRDSTRFTNADHLDWDRPSSDVRAHLAFGMGIHYCLGAALARVEAEIAVRQLTQRFPRARLAVWPNRLHRQRSVIMNGFQALPLLLGAE